MHASTPTLPRRSRPSRWRLIAVALLACTGAVVAVAPADAAPTAAPNLTAVTIKPASGGDVQVSWSSAASAYRWRVIVVVDDRYLGMRTFAGSARTGRISDIPPGTSITVGVGAIDPAGTYVTWRTSPWITTPRDSSCPKTTANTCVHVNAKSTTTNVTGVGLGILHGITSNTDPARVDSLHVRHWRFAATDEARFQLAKRAGGSITVVLSDPWMWQMYMPDGRAYSPWTGFDFYRWWVTSIVQWHVDHGLVPDRWEVQNEPLASSFDAAHPDQDSIVQQHTVATQAIRQVLPGAKIVGPSFYPFQMGTGVVDFEAFANKAKASGLTLDGIAWHEITGACQDCDGGPSTVRQHLDDARAALAAVGLGSLPIDITEYGASYEQLQPGAILGYLSALSDGGVRFGGASCWDRADGFSPGCFAPEGTLDGLLLPDGRTPTDAWWTYEAYAQLSSSGKLVRTTVDDATTSVVSSVSGNVVRTLIGRHQGCTAADAPCPNGTTPGATETVNLRTTLPSVGLWNVVVTRISSTTGASEGPQTVLSTPVVSVNGVTSLGTFSLADGEVLQVVATRVTAP